MNHYSKLIADGLIQVVVQKLLSTVAPDDNGYTGESGNADVVIAGRPSMFIWESIGLGELKLSVWWDYIRARNPAAVRERFSPEGPLAKTSRYPEFVGAMASAWLERQAGCYIQGFGGDGIFNTYLRRGTKETIDKMQVPELSCFALQGKVRMLVLE